MRKTHLLITALVSAAPAFARTVVRPMPFSQIVANAEQIFIGTVQKQSSRFENKGQTIRSYVVFGKLLVKKGNLGSNITLRLEGGTVGDDTLHIPGMPRFRTGKRYLCYVSGNGKNFSPIVGFHQGVFEVATKNGRQVLITQSGHELIGIQKDRLVLAGKRVRMARRGSEVRMVPGSYRAGRSNASALEARAGLGKKRAQSEPRPVPVAPLPRVKVEQKGKTRPGVPSVPAARPQRSVKLQKERPRSAAPIVIEAKADKGLRMDLGSILHYSKSKKESVR